jgi:hypothetical protein
MYLWFHLLLPIKCLLPQAILIVRFCCCKSSKIRAGFLAFSSQEHRAEAEEKERGWLSFFITGKNKD